MTDPRKLSMGILALALSACAVHEGDMSAPINSSFNGSQTGIQAFQNGFYSFAQSQNCTKCHGASTHPLFASSDLTTAYNEAKGNQIGSTVPLIDFSNPTASIIATYAGNNHCGDTPCSNPANTSVVQSLLQQWAAAELAGNGGGGGGITAVQPAKYLSQTVAIPSNLPNLTKPAAVMRFDLSKVIPTVPAFVNAVLEIEIQLITPTEYRISRPKIAGISGAVNISGIHVYIRPSNASGLGGEDTAQGDLWDTLSATAPAFALPNPLPTGPMQATPLTTQAIQIQVQSGAGDSLTIGFDNVQ